MIMVTKADEILQIWTVYDHPSDYPDKYVARLHVVSKSGTGPTTEMFVADTLEELRVLLPPGLYCLPRYAADDPVIVETWF
jgi:hypothetical protein